MIAPGTFAKQPALIERAIEPRGTAFLCELAETCREWPELANWLFYEFGRDPKVREGFRALIAAPPAQSVAAVDALAALSGGSAARKEKARVIAELGADVARRWGGRTWPEMQQLVRRYEAGTLDLGVFMLVRNWRKAGARAKLTPELRRGHGAFRRRGPRQSKSPVVECSGLARTAGAREQDKPAGHVRPFRLVETACAALHDAPPPRILPDARGVRAPRHAGIAD